AVGVSGLTATVLGDDTVLLAGGINSLGKSVSAAELYDPALGGFIKLPAMKKARSHHTATLLANGKVLIAGGENSSVPLASLEIFDPASGKVTETGSLNQARTLASASMLLDLNGDVLIEGGRDANGIDLDTAEEFD